MGLHFSRLAVAVSLALSCSVLPAMAAADQPLDEFYIEIKGPDKPTSPLLTPKAENSDSTPVRAQPEKRPAVRRAADAGIPVLRATREAGIVTPSALDARLGTLPAISYSPAQLRVYLSLASLMDLTIEDIEGFLGLA